MYFRSTGLGNKELAGKMVEMKRQGDFVVMYVDTHEPVKWKIRAAMSFGDLATGAKSCMKVAVLKFLLSPKQWFNKNPKHPGEF
jgi:hypothetical protein